MKTMKEEELTDSNTGWWLTHKGISASFICIGLFAIFVRVAVSLHPYSGAGDPPKYGDFEAQRHWMEITLNLPLRAVAAVLSNKELVSSFLFSPALNDKQVSNLGLVVLGAFALVWWPYLYSKDAFLEVLSRLAPFERGIYEDYVANFWCTTSVLKKWKRLFTTQSVKLFSLAATASCLPSMFLQIRAPTNQTFLYELLNSAFSFYLFSFQVHEKSILLPLSASKHLGLGRAFSFSVVNTTCLALYVPSFVS